jgi:predicted DNA-binding transcriptional regulator YafY
MPPFPSASDQSPLIGRLRALCAHADNGDDIRVKFRYTNAQGRVEQVENGWVYRLVERNHLGNMVVQVEVELEEGIHVRWFRVDRMENLITSEEVEVLEAAETLTEGMSKYDTLAQLIADGLDSPTVSFTATTDAGETKEIRRAYVLGVTPAGPRTNNRERVMVRVHDSDLNQAFDVRSINNLVIDEPVVQDAPVMSVYDTLVRVTAAGLDSPTVSFTNTDSAGATRELRRVYVLQIAPARPELGITEAQVEVRAYGRNTSETYNISNISNLVVDERVAGELPVENTYDILTRVASERSNTATVSFTYTHRIDGAQRIHNARVLQTWLAYPQLDVNEAVVKVILQGDTEGQLFAIDRIGNLGVNANMREALERIVGVEGYTVSFADAGSNTHWRGMHLIEVTSERAKFVRDPRINPRYSLKVPFEDISNLIVSNDVPDEADGETEFSTITPWRGVSGPDLHGVSVPEDTTASPLITGAPTRNPLAGQYFDGTDAATEAAVAHANTEETTLLLELFTYLSSRYAEGQDDELSFTYTNTRGRVERIQHGWVTGVEPVNRNGNPIVTVEIDDRTRTFRIDRMDDISTSVGPNTTPNFPGFDAGTFVELDVLPLAEEVEYFSSLMTPSSTVVNFTYRNAQGRVENISNGTVVDVQGRNRNGNFVITVETPERQGDRARTFRVDRITNLVVVFDPTSEQAINEPAAVDYSAVDYVDFDALDAAAEVAAEEEEGVNVHIDELVLEILVGPTEESVITFDYTSAQGARRRVANVTPVSLRPSNTNAGKNVLVGFVEREDGLFARKTFRTDRIQNVTVTER